MIQKIQSNEYLKRVDNMTAAEKELYRNRVVEWLQAQSRLLTSKMDEENARFLNVTQCSATWNDAECNAWTEGVRLLSALAPTAETWLPDMLYVKAARRCIKRMTDILNSVRNVQQNVSHSTASEHQDKPLPMTKAVRESNAATDTAKTHSAAEPVRPKHIDQYVHLLPQKTQERAANVKGLLRDLDTAREKMRLLMDDPQASDDARALWAKTATKLDEKINAIYKELDAEWAKLVKEGRVVVDDLGNAHVKPTPDPSQVGGEDGATEAAELTSEQKARRRDLRKWLTDTRRGNGATRDEHLAKWQENFKEYLALEPREVAMKDEKILAAMKHYGIKIEDV